MEKPNKEYEDWKREKLMQKLAVLLIIVVFGGGFGLCILRIILLSIDK